MTAPRNLPASVQGRLRNLAVARGEPAAVLYTRYALERLLYRLSVSPHRRAFVLKGAMLFVLWTETPHRSTVDLDLLGYGTSEAARIEAVFRDLYALLVEDDGLTFDAGSVRVEPVREEEEYEGLRVRLRAHLGVMRLDLKVDIGFGDAVTPRPEQITYRTLLPFPAPALAVYPRETVVAEKYQAMVALGLANSRMKDLFDVWALARSFAFDGGTLSEAIRATFERRRTPLPATTPVVLTAAFAEGVEKQAQWRAFTAKGRPACLTLCRRCTRS